MFYPYNRNHISYGFRSNATESVLIVFLLEKFPCLIIQKQGEKESFFIIIIFWYIVIFWHAFSYLSTLAKQYISDFRKLFPEFYYTYFEELDIYVKLCVTEEAGGIQLSHCSCLVSNLRRPAGPGWHKQQLVSTEPPVGEPPHHSWGDTRIVNKYG